ncbi:phytanoyl-CoA dioxygenase family protein [Horticoccus luteus]|uniref:Phytanoyl-CoA dioxygenase family protein n=1 Tax=Horticoccus luteus TaxID=2862869 RepID=A0A8F9XKG1_9BACT|nr:phytanoyl-CoA dioxygenase family protein [Horticoccus luteus]QYM79658.1 phytanoyl-CoA dioxygenase family protein [Horticoccus luteus]
MSTPTPEQQRSFFETFGFLKFPGLVKAELPQILAEFEAVFPQLGIKHDGTKRTMIISFVDQRAGLSALLDHPGVLAAVSNLIGPDFNYVSSDGNYYTGETSWHRDSLYKSNSYIKIAFYLDKVTRDSGALRVLPGSHRDEVQETWDDDELRASATRWGVEMRDLPAHALESEPGDMLVFSHRLRHASFGGGHSRRMFTMNLGRRAKTPQEVDDLISYVANQWSGYVPAPYGPAMLETATPARRVHLTQGPEYWEAGIARRKERAGKGA